MLFKQWTAYLMMAAAMVTVGSTIVASQMMGEIPVFVAAFLRFSIAGAVLIALARLAGKRLPRLPRREWRVLGVQALVGSVGYSVLLMAGLAWTAASDASVIAGTLPAVAALASTLFLGERLGRCALAGIALATLGVAMLGLAGGDTGAHGSARWAGNALVLAAVGCEAVFLLLNKSIKTEIDPLLVAAIMAVLSMMFCVVPALCQWWFTPGPVVTARAASAALYYALVPTVIGFFLWYKGASMVSGAEASLLTAVYPVTGLFFSAALLGVAIETAHAGAIAVTVLGIVTGALGSRTGWPVRDRVSAGDRQPGS
ncbi:MAG: DMT family transporter [Pseudomonadota bacterium]